MDKQISASEFLDIEGAFDNTNNDKDEFLWYTKTQIKPDSTMNLWGF